MARWDEGADADAQHVLRQAGVGVKVHTAATSAFQSGGNRLGAHIRVLRRCHRCHARRHEPAVVSRAQGSPVRADSARPQTRTVNRETRVIIFCSFIHSFLRAHTLAGRRGEHPPVSQGRSEARSPFEASMPWPCSAVQGRLLGRPAAAMCFRCPPGHLPMKLAPELHKQSAHSRSRQPNRKSAADGTINSIP
jgi:hypothetical protein